MIDIQRKASNLIRRYGTRNPFKLADELGIEVDYKVYSSNTKGYYIYVARNPYIVINSSLKEQEQRIIGAHELGHGVLHKKKNINAIREYTLFPTGPYEIQANKFAAELLIDDACFDIAQDCGYTIEQLSAYFSVPLDLMKYKFLNHTM